MAVLYNIDYDDINVWSTIVSGGWGIQNYRHIILTKDKAKDDFGSWLDWNAVRLPLTGTWAFNSTLSNASFEFSGNFISNGTNYSAIKFSAGYFYYNSIEVYQNASTVDSGWADEAYRTITFTSPVQYYGNEDFVKWFTQNAYPVAIFSLDMIWSGSGFDAEWLSSNSPAFLTYTLPSGTTATEAPSSSVTSYAVPANSLITIYLPGQDNYAYPQLSDNYKNFTWATNPTTGHDAKFYFTISQGETVTLNAKVVSMPGVMTNLPT